MKSDPVTNAALARVWLNVVEKCVEGGTSVRYAVDSADKVVEAFNTRWLPKSTEEN